MVRSVYFVFLIAIFAVSTLFSNSIDGMISRAKNDPTYAAEAQQQIEANPALLDQLTPAQRAELEELKRKKEHNEEHTEERREERESELESVAAALSGDPSIAVDSLESEVHLEDTAEVVVDAAEEKRPVYGHHLFATPKMDLSYRETPDSYMLAPGDEVYFRFWGRYNEDKRYLIRDKGVVYLEPLQKEVYLAGKTYGQVKRLVDNITKEVPGVEGEVDVVSTRPLQVNFAGHCVSPGAQRFPAHYTFWQALLSSGGPSVLGSVRDIRLVRYGKTVARVDIYKFLQTGTRPRVNLKENDVIFFGPVGSIVTVDDFVEASGAYELKKGETLESLVSYAGGLKSGDFLPEITMQRFIPLNKRVPGGGTREYKEVTLSGQAWKRTALRDGDALFARAIPMELNNDVYLLGSGVEVPGGYALSAATATLQKLIDKAGGLVEGHCLTAELLRYTEFGRVISRSVSLNEGGSASGLALLPRDTVYIYHKKDQQEDVVLSSEGFVREPLVISAVDSLSLFLLLQRSNGLGEGALPYVHIRKEDTLGVVRYEQQDIRDREQLKKIYLENRDKVIAYDYRDFNRELPVVALAYGDEPIVMRYSEDLDLSILIHRLNGLHPLVDSSRVEFNYPDFSGINSLTRTRSYAIDEAEDDKSLLTPGCIVILRKDPKKHLAQYVSLHGEFVSPGRYTLDSKSDNLEKIIDKASGFSVRANPYSLRIIRKDDTIPVEVEVLEDGSVDYAINWVLNGSDEIYVALNSHSVSVYGAVFDEREIAPFNQEYRWHEYVKNVAGGFLDTADVHRSYIVYPNGVTKKARRRTPVVSGSTIIVPQKPYKEPKIRRETDWGDVAKVMTALASLVLSAATLYTLSNNANTTK